MGQTSNNNLNSTILPLIEAFGGEGNIESIDSCITRLHMTVRDVSKTASDDVFRSLGAMGVIRPRGSNKVQAIYGAKTSKLAEKMITYLNSKGHNF